MKTFLPLISFFLYSSLLSAQTFEAQKEVPVTVTVLSDQLMHTIPSDFLGFSYEMSQLTDNSHYLHSDNLVLSRMIRNLGYGILRIGGNTSDKIIWTGKSRTNSTGQDSLTTTDIDDFSKFVHQTGWKVAFGLNLGQNNPEVNADEAVYVSKRLKNALLALQIGNEPDLYYKHLRRADYSEEDYEKEWLSYYIEINKRLPNVSFAGPAAAGDIRWFNAFLRNNSDKIKLMTGHHYNSPGKNASVNWKTILESDNHLSVYLQTLNFLSEKYGITYRMAECNSVSMGGREGVSNVFASALWALDYMWNVALNKGKGVNFHGGSVSKYAPIVMNDKGISTPRPLYYAMLAFKQASKDGTMVPIVVSPTVPNCSAYACMDGKTIRVTLLNKSEDNIAFTIRLNATPASVQVLRLTAPSPTSTSKVSFAGSEVDADGSFQMNTREKYKPQNKHIPISVPAMSAAVIVIDKY